MCTGFNIAIPSFNTTLSRVDRLEIAAVVEVLLALRRNQPRNVSPDVAAAIRSDVVRFVTALEERARVSGGAPSCCSPVRRAQASAR